MDRREFGPYQLLELLGRGGMGEVYRAYDTSTNRTVAIKVLPPHLAEDEVFQQRFQREARIAAALNEPHVVPIHRYGEIDGRLYVDMRLIEGGDLQAALARGPIAPPRAVYIVEQVAAALEAAHRAGLVHRDVKPSNILLTHRDFVYLIDFGIAHSLDETSITNTGQTIGSVAYMAPERFGHGQTDARSDVYALACVLHECLTGQRPFPGRSAAEQITGHMMTAPPRPSALGFPVALDHVMATGMAKDPAARYQSPDDLARAARDALYPSPAAAPAFTTQPWQRHGDSGFGPASAPLVAPRYAPPQAWWKRHPVALTAMVAAVVTAVAMTALIVAYRPADERADAAVDINGLLLPPREIESILGEQSMVVTSRSDAVGDDPLDEVTPAVCDAIVYLTSRDLLEASDPVQMRGVSTYASSNNYLPHVVQDVVEFPTDAVAQKFYADTVESWKSCLDEDISVAHDNGNPETNRFDDLEDDGGVVSVKRSVAEASDGFGCQHAIAARSNYVVTARACSFALTDQGREVATRIADRVSPS